MTAKSKTATHRPTERKDSAGKPVVKKAANAVKAALKQAKKPK